MFKVGFRQGVLDDPTRRDWDDDGPRPIRWSAWYPAMSEAVERRVELPPDAPLFVMGDVAREAPLARQERPFPVVLLSHGTGGTAAGLGWLAQGLARAGHLVVGVDHHGNTASEPYRAEGFLCWWERPRDLTVALDRLLVEGPFAGRLDAGQVSVAGFSLGGHAALALAGAITEMPRFLAWARHRNMGEGPREFPHLPDHIEPLLESSEVFRASWQRQSANYLDRRVRAVFACAPAPTVRGFTPESLATIDLPVMLAVGGADHEAPAPECVGWLAAHLPRVRVEPLGEEVGHYVFLAEGTARGRVEMPELWQDPPGVDRCAVQAHVVALARQALRQTIA
ncbi:alpha/beta hydrolase family protein [Ancylobacter sp. VNQ12]|uniref:alpha/beta hydrolase family protein n=1 Tax=Ancylobacter sp. VNQ12 TaxID=3400920 RepID=UPI003C0D1361